MGQQVAKLSADLFANTARFEQDLKRAGKSFKGFGDVIKKGAKASAAAVAGIALGLGALSVRQASVIDETAKLSAALGVNVRDYQALALAASEAGINQEQVGTILTKSQRSIVEASRGLETYARSFETLGLNVQDLLHLSPDEQFLKIGEALNSIDNPTIRTATALEIFGRSGRQVINMLSGLNENVAKAAEFNDKFGISLNRIDAAKVEEANDTFARVKKAIGGLGSTMAVKFAPVITEVSNLFLASGINAEAFGASIDKGMMMAAKAIDVVRIAVLGIKSMMAEVGLAIDLLVLDTTTNMWGLFKAMEGLPKMQGIAEAGQEKMLAMNEAAAQSAKKHMDAMSGLEKEAANFGKTADRLAQIQEEATARAKERFNGETARGMESINVLLDDTADKEKELEKLEKERIKNAKELGLTFSSAFEKAIQGGEGFSDVLAGLGKDIENILIRRTITEPIDDIVTGLVSGIGGGGKGGGLSDIFGSIFGSLPSFDVGTNRVPRDMIAQVHRDEMIVPAFDAAKIRNGGGLSNGGGNVNIIVNNNSKAEVSQSSRETSNGTEITMMIDEAVAENIGRTGSKTHQAMSAMQNQVLVRR